MQRPSCRRFRACSACVREESIHEHRIARNAGGRERGDIPGLAPVMNDHMPDLAHLSVDIPHSDDGKDKRERKHDVADDLLLRCLS